MPAILGLLSSMMYSPFHIFANLGDVPGKSSLAAFTITLHLDTFPVPLMLADHV